MVAHRVMCIAVQRKYLSLHSLALRDCSIANYNTVVLTLNGVVECDSIQEPSSAAPSLHAARVWQHLCGTSSSL